MYIVRMTNLNNPDGLYIQACKTYDIAMDMCDTLRKDLNTYNNSNIVDARSLFRYSDHSTRFIITDE